MHVTRPRLTGPDRVGYRELGEYLGRELFGDTTMPPASRSRGDLASEGRLFEARHQLGQLLATAYTGQLNARTAAAALNGVGCLGSQLLKEYIEVAGVSNSRASLTLGVSATTLSLAINGKTGVSIRLALELIATILLDAPQGQQSRLLDRTEQLMQAMSTGERPDLAIAMEKLTSQASATTAEANHGSEPVVISDYLDAMRSLADETNTRLLILAHARMNLNATEFGLLLSAGVPDTGRAATSPSSISRKLRALAQSGWLTVDHTNSRRSATGQSLIPSSADAGERPPGNQTVYRWNDLPAGHPDALPTAYADLWDHHLRQIGKRIATELRDTFGRNWGKMKGEHAVFVGVARKVLETYVAAKNDPAAKEPPMAPDTDFDEPTKISSPRPWFRSTLERIEPPIDERRIRRSLDGTTDLTAENSAMGECADEEESHRLRGDQRYVRLKPEEVADASRNAWRMQVFDAHYDQLFQASIKAGISQAEAGDLLAEVFLSLQSTGSDDSPLFEPGSLHAEKFLHRMMARHATRLLGEDDGDRLRHVLRIERLQNGLESIENDRKDEP